MNPQQSPYNIEELLPLDLQGWNSNSPVFEGILKTIRAKTIIEVGTWKGASTVHMGTICRWLEQEEGQAPSAFNVGPRTIWAIDVFEPTPAYPDVPANLYQQFLSNVLHFGLQDMIVPVKASSDQAFEALKLLNVNADVIYLDGNHEYEFVKRDIENYFQLLKPHGVIFGDDYIGWPGVIQAVDEFRESHPQLHFQSFHEKWIFRLP